MSGHNQVQSVALLGTGLMGEPMAARLLNAGCSLTVWNRTAEKVRALVAKGARSTASPAEAATDADMVITMLADGPAVGGVLFDGGVAGTLSPGAIVADMSSIPPATARDHSARLAKQSIMLDVERRLFPHRLEPNRRKSVRALVAKGARSTASPAEAATDADMVITMLADGPAVGGVLFDGGVAGTLSPGAIVADMSSIPPATARDHSARLAKQSIMHLDAPVSGGTKGAAEGTLAIMAGGSLEAFERARQVLEVMGRPTLIGPSGAGQLAKLANQTIVAVTIGAVSEA